MFYAHECPETHRWFVCCTGLDNNVCECFDWNGSSAEQWAKNVSDLLSLAVAASGDIPDKSITRIQLYAEGNDPA